MPRAGLRAMLFAAPPCGNPYTSPVSRRRSPLRDPHTPPYAAAWNAGELSRASEAVRLHHRSCRGSDHAVNGCSGTAQTIAFISSTSTRLVIAPTANCTWASGSAWPSASCPHARAKSSGCPKIPVGHGWICSPRLTAPLPPRRLGDGAAGHESPLDITIRTPLVRWLRLAVVTGYPELALSSVAFRTTTVRMHGFAQFRCPTPRTLPVQTESPARHWGVRDHPKDKDSAGWFAV